MKKLKPKCGDIVLVQWVDSARVTNWTYEKPNLEQHLHESVGWLSDRSKEVINVRPHRSRDRDGDEQHVGDLVIPCRAILNIRVVERAT